MVSGLLVVALPITIIGGNYQEVHDEMVKANTEVPDNDPAAPNLPVLAAQMEGQLAELNASMQAVTALFAKAADSTSNDSAGEVEASTAPSGAPRHQPGHARPPPRMAAGCGRWGATCWQHTRCSPRATRYSTQSTFVSL